MKFSLKICCEIRVLFTENLKKKKMFDDTFMGLSLFFTYIYRIIHFSVGLVRVGRSRVVVASTRLPYIYYCYFCFGLFEQSLVASCKIKSPKHILQKTSRLKINLYYMPQMGPPREAF